MASKDEKTVWNLLDSLYKYVNDTDMTKIVALTTPQGKPAGVPMMAFYQHPYTARTLG